MFNVPITDSQSVIVHAGPHTASTPGSPAKCFSFQCAVSGSSDPSGILEITILDAGPDTPSFKLRPKFKFFGIDKVITLTMSGVNDGTSPRKSTDMTCTIS